MVKASPTTRLRFRPSTAKTKGDTPLPVLAMIIGGTLFVVLGVAAYITQHSTRESLDHILRESLQTTIDAEVAALDIWLSGNLHEVSSWANAENVRGEAISLIEQAEGTSQTKQTLLASAELEALRNAMQPVQTERSFSSFGVTDRSGLFVAAENDEIIGTWLTPTGMAGLTEVIRRDGFVLRPHYTKDIFEAAANDADTILMLVGAPIRNDKQHVVGVLWFALDPLQEFLPVLDVARPGRTGETYVFDRNGQLLSESRFNDQLRSVQLLKPGQRSMLNVHLRDPGGDLTHGFNPTTRLEQRPLTRMAAAAVTGEAGVDLNGYRDYRGVEVLGAWKWMEKYDMGIATEVDAEAARTILRPVRRASWGLLALLGAACIWILFNFLRARWLTKRIEEIKQLGQYTLEEKIGEGGMGIVYRASHALLRRPTAVKLLKTNQISDETVERFEREVQITSQLSHPNTIEIYDFGRNGDGVFYYAMEYLDGVSLAQLIEYAGPLPANRAIHLLRQVCSSLAEAHNIGLIHRDIKPLNIMLCERGGMADVVKVLDFGLVKDIAASDQAPTTMPDVIPGTPLYTPPERLRDPSQVDARTDIYALGVVGFNLLTGRDVFQGRSAMDICQQVMHAPRPVAQECVEHELPAQLNHLLFTCIAKNPDERPDDVASMLSVLDALALDYPWTDRDAKQWWGEHRHNLATRFFLQERRSTTKASTPSRS